MILEKILDGWVLFPIGCMFMSFYFYRKSVEKEIIIQKSIEKFVNTQISFLGGVAIGAAINMDSIREYFRGPPGQPGDSYVAVPSAQNLPNDLRSHVQNLLRARNISTPVNRFPSATGEQS